MGQTKIYLTQCSFSVKTTADTQIMTFLHNGGLLSRKLWFKDSLLRGRELNSPQDLVFNEIAQLVFDPM